MVVSTKPNSPKINIAIDGQQIEQVTSYMYLGSLITEYGRCEKYTKRRIMIARTTFTNMRTLLSCRGINLKTRLRAIKCYIWPTLLYGAETCTITKSLLSRLDAFEMWVYGKYHGQKHFYQRGSIEKDGDRQRNSETIQDQEITISWTSRHNTSQLQLIEGKIRGRRSRGRPRNTWTTDITTTKGMKYYQLKRAAEDRKRWHGLVVNLTQETTLR